MSGTFKIKVNPTRVQDVMGHPVVMVRKAANANNNAFNSGISRKTDIEFGEREEGVTSLSAFSMISLEFMRI